jgi:hypothetical protein
MKLNVQNFIIALATGAMCMLSFPALAEKPDFVDAYFRDVDAKGCIKTDVYVFAHTGIEDVAPEASVKISRYNECATDSESEILMDASGSAQVPKKSLTVDNRAQSARLNTTVRAYDSVTGKDIPLRLNLTWTGTSDAKPSQNGFFYQIPGVAVKTAQRVNSISRIAQASGSLSDGFTNYTPGVSDDAEISKSAPKKK